LLLIWWGSFHSFPSPSLPFLPSYFHLHSIPFPHSFPFRELLFRGVARSKLRGGHMHGHCGTRAYKWTREGGGGRTPSGNDSGVRSFWMPDGSSKVVSISVFCKLASQAPNVTDFQPYPSKKSPDFHRSQEQPLANVGWTVHMSIPWLCFLFPSLRSPKTS